MDPSLYRPSFGLNMRRLLAEEPLAVRLSDEDLREVQPQVQALGLSDGQPIVTLHVREAGYKASTGVEDRAKDTVRNARIESYLPAIDWLVSHGYTVVRIGDSSMAPLQRDGVIDLATLPSHSLGLDLYYVKRSAFFIATDSGPYNLSLLCDTPCLATNMTHVLGAYPLRARDRYVVRRVDDLSENRELTLNDMLTPQHLKFRWDSSKYRFHDNSPEDILDGVQEMVSVTRGPWQPSAVQRAFRDTIVSFLATDYGRRKLKQPAGTPYFVGDGWATAASARAVCDDPAGQASGPPQPVAG
jgi:putative glycosyltransferase (TIGR04372 family)